MHSPKASYNQTLRLSRRECVSSLELEKKTIWVYVI